jgi:hypothetical protein
VQDKVDGDRRKKDTRSGGRSIIMGNNSEEIGGVNKINITSMKVYNEEEEKEEQVENELLVSLFWLRA